MKLKGRSKSSKTILNLADVHEGAVTSVCTPEPVISDLNTTFKPNKLQKALYNVWESIPDTLSKKKTDLIVING